MLIWREMISRKPTDMLKQYRQGVSEGEQKMRERVMLALGIPFTDQTGDNDVRR